MVNSQFRSARANERTLSGGWAANTLPHLLRPVKRFLQTSKRVCSRKRRAYSTGVGNPSVEPPGHEAWRLMAEMMLSNANQDRFHNACVAADVTPPLLKALMSF